MTEVTYYEPEEQNDDNDTEDCNSKTDPLYSKVSTNPLVNGGANFKTRKLVQEHTNRLSFKTTVGAYIFSLVFLSIGIAGGIGSLLGIYHGQYMLGIIFLLVFTPCFGGAGGVLLYFSMKPVVFDKSNGYFWYSYKAPSAYNRENTEAYTKLDEVHAIQIIAERVSGGKNSSSFKSYEMNLVLSDGSRKNVIDHGNYGAILNDSKTVANFLEVPVWNEVK